MIPPCACVRRMTAAAATAQRNHLPITQNRAVRPRTTNTYAYYLIGVGPRRRAHTASHTLAICFFFFTGSYFAHPARAGAQCAHLKCWSPVSGRWSVDIYLLLVGGARHRKRQRMFGARCEAVREGRVCCARRVRGVCLHILHVPRRPYTSTVLYCSSIYQETSGWSERR